MKGSKFPIEPIYSNYYGEGGKLAMKAKKKAAKKEAVKKAIVKKQPAVGADPTGKGKEAPTVHIPLVPTRMSLMHEAQKAGIKNFRVLNKDELQQVLEEYKEEPEKDPMANSVIVSVVDGAVKRWKSGWSKTKEKK